MITSRRRDEIVRTTTPLSAGVVFASDPIVCLGAARVTGLIYSDQSGTARIQQSIDGVNWDYTSQFSLTGGSGLAFSIELVAAYVRVEYENGATDQTVFRLAIYLS